MKVLNTQIKLKKLNVTNNNLKGNFKMNPIYTKLIEKIEDNVYELTLNFSVLNSKDNPFPIDFNVSVVGTFTFDSKSDEVKVERFMNLPAVQIIFPHLRAVVSSVTASSYMQPLLLPLSDVTKFVNL
ncbi:MAG: protein-export chaperone SecB [Acholeplasmataceae bacterium]